MIMKMHIFREFLPDHDDFVSGICHLCQFIIILSNHD